MRRVAVIGAGVSGLTAAYVLGKTADVTLYEADDRLGGHADTHDLVDSAGSTQQVDTGFIVHNRRTYPTLLRLFAELGVPTQESEMSMSVVCEGCGLQYSGAKGAPGLFAEKKSWSNPQYLAMLPQVLRFHRRAKRLLADPTAPDQTLGEFLTRGRFSQYFRDHFMTPVVAAVWSTAPSESERYPARYLFAFLEHHGMLRVTGSPTWRTVSGGSKTYVDLVEKQLTAVRLSSPVTGVRRTAQGVEVTAGDDVQTYDAAVIATHSDQALALLSEPTQAETEVLGAITYTPNPMVLHHDPTLLPSAEKARASWNYRKKRCTSDEGTVLLSYDMNRLQRLDSADPWVVTLNGADRIDPSTVVLTRDYSHPLYTPESVAAQARLPELSDGVLAFAGAYHGWGFHEDGARSGLAAAESLGARW